MEANPPYYQTRGHFTNDTNASFPAVSDEYEIPSALEPHHASHPGENENEAYGSHINTVDGNHNLFGLLQAATTAAGQAAEAMNLESQSATKGSQNRGKRRRISTPPSDNSNASGSSHAQSGGPNAPKRARTNAMVSDTLDDPQIPPSSEALLGEARAAGVHSAAALFRRSHKEPTRKYTRPPMSKLFMSLQLTPENFLQLQSRAKAYMLDPANPDRQSCVGNRGKGDTDMVKLKLFNCVREFLADGVGEQFFGRHVEKPGDDETLEAARALGQEKATAEEKLVWPDNEPKIISLVTPLLRRMVTNERQRMYAIQTRKAGGRKTEGSAGNSRDHSPQAYVDGRPGSQRPQR
jgi:hypothetical protein